jgi:hypothetical protein
MRGAAILVVWVLCAGCGQVADAQAKLVAGAYADARDAADSDAWMARSQEDCRAAAVQLGAKPSVKS